MTIEQSIAVVSELASERAIETEQLRHLHPEVVSALVEHGLLRRWVAADFGGEGATITDGLRTIEDLSRADGATGWCAMIANSTSLTSHYLPTRWAEEIYGDPVVCTGGFGMPAGTGRLVDGGIEVTGRWAWGSGTNHCTWIGGGVRIVDGDGNPSQTADGAKAPFVFFDRDDVELLDTWDVAGLRGTGSTDYSTTTAFVPEGRWVELVGAEPVLDQPLGRFPFFGALGSGVAAVTIGLACRGVDELIALGQRTSSGSSKSLAERATVQADLALSQADIAQARAYLHQVTDRLWIEASNQQPVSDETKTEIRLAATAAAIRSMEAVDRCFHAGGGAAIHSSHPLQRVFRDCHVAVSHGMIARRTLEPFGRLAFGLPTSTALF